MFARPILGRHFGQTQGWSIANSFNKFNRLTVPSIVVDVVARLGVDQPLFLLASCHMLTLNVGGQRL